MIDPLVPRPIDLPTALPLHGEIDAEVADRAKIFAAPDDPADWPAWRRQLHNWCDQAKTRFPQADPDKYDRFCLWESSGWGSRCFSSAVVWLWDERLFDHDRGEFTPDRLLADAERYGGFDAVVLWHAYPIIGLDDRNQFDFYRDVPGLGDLVGAFQRRGVRVLVDYNPWDVGTRREPVDDATALAGLVTTLGVDGVFLDTMREGGKHLVDTLRQLRPQPVLEGESRVPLERIGEHEMSWAQWFADSRAPGVMAARWFDRRHMLHHTRRWNRDHSDELQSAWMNGCGVVVWDAVFGSWVGWSERDRSTLRRMLRAQRALADVLIGGNWTPLVDATPAALDAGVYVSRFDAGSQTLWTAVNRGVVDYTGPVLDVDNRPDGVSLDVTAGTALDALGNEITVPARSIAGILHVQGTVPSAIEAMAAAQASDTHTADSSFPARLPVRLVPARSSTGPAPDEAIVLPARRHNFDVTYRLRETGMYDGAPFVEEWKPLPPRLHADVTETHTVQIGRVAVARSEVFVDGVPWTNVSLREARDHAASVGGRLPTEFEWQLAAADPAFERADPLVWNWTESEHSDGITRFAILKGGCAHGAAGSDWYFDGGPRSPDFSAKLLLAGLGVDRSPSIGFRLAWDLDDDE